MEAPPGSSRGCDAGAKGGGESREIFLRSSSLPPPDAIPRVATLESAEDARCNIFQKLTRFT